MNLPKNIPIFPLSNFIIFPKTTVPLNIFEPRYIDMINDSMKKNKLIGMIQPKNLQNINVSNPDLHEIGCLGKITTFKETDDNRYLIELKGIIRFKITKEIDSKKNNFMEFTKDLDIGTAPSLRYKYLHSISRLKKKDNRFIILVALPIFMDQSENILSVIAESLDAFQHMGDIGIHIKVHPTKSADSFKSKFIN